jgi:hypothetical protein
MALPNKHSISVDFSDPVERHHVRPATIIEHLDGEMVAGGGVDLPNRGKPNIRATGRK